MTLRLPHASLLSSPSHPGTNSRNANPLTFHRGETATVSFIWKTGNYEPGVHTLVATLVSANNATTGHTSAQLHFLLTAPVITASVSAVTVKPESPVVGDAVTIAIEVRNHGPATASIPVTLHFPSPDKQPETRRPRVAAGATGTAEFTWRTTRYQPGTHQFRVDVGAEPLTSHLFTVELQPPTTDFAVLDIYPPSSSRPIVKGDWMEVAAFVRNLGPHPGRATIDLYNETQRKTMYSRSVSLDSGESRVVEFTWKTLRYEVGEHRIVIEADGRYDTNRDNDRSDSATVNILTDRDITLVFGRSLTPDSITDVTAKPSVRTAAQYPEEILVVNHDAPRATGSARAIPSRQFSAETRPYEGTHETAAAYRSGQSAQTSAGHCAQYQVRVGETQPRAVLCPKAPYFIR